VFNRPWHGPGQHVKRDCSEECEGVLVVFRCMRSPVTSAATSAAPLLPALMALTMAVPAYAQSSHTLPCIPRTNPKAGEEEGVPGHSSAQQGARIISHTQLRVGLLAQPHEGFSRALSVDPHYQLCCILSWLGCIADSWQSAVLNLGNLIPSSAAALMSGGLAGGDEWSTALSMCCICPRTLTERMGTISKPP